MKGDQRVKMINNLLATGSAGHDHAQTAVPVARSYSSKTRLRWTSWERYHYGLQIVQWFFWMTSLDPSAKLLYSWRLRLSLSDLELAPSTRLWTGWDSSWATFCTRSLSAWRF